MSHVFSLSLLLFLLLSIRTHGSAIFHSLNIHFVNSVQRQPNARHTIHNRAESSEQKAGWGNSKSKKLKVKVLNTLPEPVPEQADICKSVLRGRWTHNYHINNRKKKAHVGNQTVLYVWRSVVKMIVRLKRATCVRVFMCKDFQVLLSWLKTYKCTQALLF